jgi:hypothetical protein
MGALGYILYEVFYRKGRRIMIRRIVVIIFALFLVHASVFTAYGGTINPQEVRVIESASGFFDNLGESYVPTDDALSQMNAYLNQDTVDLTELQANRIIELMHSDDMIKTAINGGYIVPALAATDNQTSSLYEPLTDNPVKAGFDTSILLILILLLVTVTIAVFAYAKKKIRFIVVPLIFVFLLAGILGTVGASAKNILLANLATTIIFGAPETDALSQGNPGATV